MNRLLLSLLLIAAVTHAVNACSPASTLGDLDRLPDPAMLRVMQFCSTDMQYLNKAGNRIVRNHLPTILRAHHFFADTSDYYITKYALAVIASGKAPQWVHVALLDAARAGNIAEVNRLLTAPYIDVNARSHSGWTALHWAVCWCHTAVVRALLADPRTDVNAHTKEGLTALMAAADQDNSGIVAALLADSRTTAETVNAQENNGETALMLAALKGRAGMVAALLADSRTDVNARNNDGKTALDFARERYDRAIVAMIEAHIAKATTHHQSCCTIS